MICGHCGETATPETCAACGQDPLLDGRYRLESIVGRGAAGITYRAVRVSDGEAVAIKEMAFHRIDAEKVTALYERETRVLQQLDHPRIPDYVDHFVAGAGKHRSLYLAQQFIDGVTLDSEMAERRYREEDVLEIVIEVARILVYLHDLRPPVIHRDLKPGNLMRRHGDGALVLVDFGAVRDALADPAMGGSTVVGTYGFMAPEQYRGDASPATDLYALGVTAAVLLSRQPANTLTETPGRVDWKQYLDVHPATGGLLDDLLDHDPARRLGDARRAIARAEAAIKAIEDARRRPPPEPEQAPRTRDASFDPMDFGDSGEMGAFSDDGPPASTRSAAGAAFWLMMAIVVFIGLFVVLQPQSGETPAVISASGQTCGGGEPCRAPHGLKGLEFGMTVAQAQAALPELVGAMPATKGMRIDLSRLSMAGFDIPQVPVPGPAYDLETTIGAFGARCRLEFAVEATLSNIACELDGYTSLGAQQDAEQALLDALTQRYGQPSSLNRPGDPSGMNLTHRFSATWSDREAEARIESSFESFMQLGIDIDLPPKSALTLENTWARHRALIERLEAQARDEAAEEKRRRDEAARQAAEEARRRIEDSKGALGDDL